MKFKYMSGSNTMSKTIQNLMAIITLMIVGITVPAFAEPENEQKLEYCSVDYWSLLHHVKSFRNNVPLEKAKQDDPPRLQKNAEVIYEIAKSKGEAKAIMQTMYQYFKCSGDIIHKNGYAGQPPALVDCSLRNANAFRTLNAIEQGKSKQEYLASLPPKGVEVISKLADVLYSLNEEKSFLAAATFASDNIYECVSDAVGTKK